MKKARASWPKVFLVFSLALLGMALYRTYHVVSTAEAMKRAAEASLAKKAKAAELAHEGFEVMKQQKRNQFFARCRDDGNYPLLFIDKIVCVKPEAVAWVKYDGNPEQDTSGDTP